MTEQSSAADLQNAPRRVSEIAPRIDRNPPHALEAEQGVLGCILLSPRDCIAETSKLLKDGPHCFYDLRHITLYTHLLEMADENLPIDLLTVAQRLKDKQILDGIGGLGYLSSLPDMVPSAANLQYYVNIVWEKYLLRKALHVCTDLVGRIYEYEGEMDKLLDLVEKELMGMSASRRRGKERDVKELVNLAIGRIEQYHAAEGAILGIPSGFMDIDKLTNGFQEGDMCVIAARPSVGKTSLAMNIAEHVSIDLKMPVGVFTLEMTDEQLILRMLCSRARVNMRKIRDGFLSERDFPKLTGTARGIAHANLHIDETSGLTIEELRSKARVMWQQHGIKLFILDYINLMHCSASTSDNRQQEITMISNGIKALAKELRVPWVVLAQLNRDVEKRKKGSKPMMSDLRESGAIEQDADMVFLLRKLKGDGSDDEDDNDDDEREAIPVMAHLAKNRNGPVGQVELTFIKGITRFESAARVNPDDVPAES